MPPSAHRRQPGFRRAYELAAAVLVAVLIVGVALKARGDGEPAPGGFVRWKDDTVHGPWRSVFDGHGRNGIRGGVISLRPMEAAGPDKTHAGLVVSQAAYGDVDFELETRTVETLRKPAANPWEVSWAVWAYADDHHFYYLALKPNGWELGKRDPAYPGGQRFLATGEKNYEIGEWYSVAIRQRGATQTVWVDGHKLASFTDLERPYLTGAVGLYTEDAEVEFKDIKITS